MTEAVDRLAGAVADVGEARLDDQFPRDALAGEMAHQAVALVGRVAQTEPLPRRVADAALGKIGARLVPGAAGQLAFEPAAGLLEDIVEGRGASIALPLFRAALGHRETGTSGKPLHGLGKREVLGLHHIADDIAVGSAAEAVIETLGVGDREGRGLLLMEGTQPDILAAAALQADAGSYDLGQQYARPDLFQEFRGEQHLGLLNRAVSGRGRSPRRRRSDPDRMS